MRFRRHGYWKPYSAAACMAAALFWAPAQGRASSPDSVEPAQSLLGSYLAGRFARNIHDTGSAAEYYRQALGRDPESDLIVEQSFLMEATEGNYERATELARRLVAAKSASRLTRTWLGVAAFKAGNYDAADEHLNAAGTGPIGELTSSMARAWNKLAQGDARAALALLEGNRQSESAEYYLRYHRALISDIADRRSEARQAYERTFKLDSRTPRIVLAYAQHAAHAGDAKLARSIVKEHLEKVAGDGHPAVRALRDKLQATDKLPLLIDNAADGFAEVFFGLGEALMSEGGVGLGAIYLQMSLHVSPSSPFALAALANVYEATRRYGEANEIYDRMPKDTPMQMAVEIRKAVNLNQLDRVDESKSLLEAIAKAHPEEISPLDTLGNIMRSRKRYTEAIEYYSRAIALIPRPQQRHWNYWYSRGTCYERTKQWPLAEADLQRALKLSPDQPLALNYLGYSWIDQNRNLRQGLAMIEKAVAKKPDDGYIVDSLGWAHYRLGNYKDAVRYLERAVELKPEDPTLNDHLGDSLWRVGRKREAKFQWDQALTLNPEPEDAEKIARKLQHGLTGKPLVPAAKKAKDAVRADTQKKQVKTQLAPLGPIQ
jgi:tetratricopeptide (TPR) repeat protein